MCRTEFGVLPVGDVINWHNEDFIQPNTASLEKLNCIFEPSVYDATDSIMASWFCFVLWGPKCVRANALKSQQRSKKFGSGV